jgi:hypothetical protein
MARCHFDLGRLYPRMGACQQAREHLEGARAMFSELDMRFWLEQAEAALTKLD